MILAEPIKGLTNRELQVLELIVADVGTKGICIKLGLGHSTVEYHRANLMRKLDCSSIVQLMKKVWRPE